MSGASLTVKNSVNAALCHYQIWFTLRGSGKAIDNFLTDMNDYRYVDFFHASNSAHYKLMFIEAGCVFDRDDRTDGLKHLREVMEKNNFHDLSNKFMVCLDPYQNLVKNILTIRSKLIAHKDSSVEPSELYSKHGIKPDEIKDLLNNLATLMSELENRLNNGASSSSVGVTDRWEKATFGLLEILQKGRRPQPK